MPGHVQGNNPQALKLGRQPCEAVGVVQPAVQGNHRQTVFGPEQMGRQLDMRQAQANLFDAAHAQLRSLRPSQRVNRSLSSAAVSCGRSSGNI
ncbi:hypothetical protein D3C75_1123960 [compost metagenome]